EGTSDSMGNNGSSSGVAAQGDDAAGGGTSSGGGSTSTNADDASSGDASGSSGASGDGAGGEPSSGSSGISATSDAAADACAKLDGELNLGLTKLRRMTRSQFDNTLRDLLGTSGSPAAGISPDASVGPFENNAFNPATDLVVEQHQE